MASKADIDFARSEAFTRGYEKARQLSFMRYGSEECDALLQNNELRLMLALFEVLMLRGVSTDQASRTAGEVAKAMIENPSVSNRPPCLPSCLRTTPDEDFGI